MTHHAQQKSQRLSVKKTLMHGAHTYALIVAHLNLMIGISALETVEKKRKNNATCNFSVQLFSITRFARISYLVYNIFPANFLD